MYNHLTTYIYIYLSTILENLSTSPVLPPIQTTVSLSNSTYSCSECTTSTYIISSVCGYNEYTTLVCTINTTCSCDECTISAHTEEASKEKNVQLLLSPSLKPRQKTITDLYLPPLPKPNSQSIACESCQAFSIILKYLLLITQYLAVQSQIQNEHIIVADRTLSFTQAQISPTMEYITKIKQ